VLIVGLIDQSAGLLILDEAGAFAMDGWEKTGAVCWKWVGTEHGQDS